MEQFQVEYRNGELHCGVEGKDGHFWTFVTDPDSCIQKLEEWLDEVA